VNEAKSSILLRLPTQDERAAFLQMFREQLGESEGSALAYVGLSWDELAGLFTSLGEIRSIVEDAGVAGFVWIELRGRELHLHAIVLSLSYRGRGVGRRVFRELKREFGGLADVIELGVQEENKSAIDFYRHLGFHDVESETAPGFLIMRAPIGCDTGGHGT